MNKESRAFKIVELVIDENDDQAGIDAISVVSEPAIQENFVALKKQEVLLKEVDSEKRILMGAALVPNRQIYRRSDKTNQEYYIFFSEETVRKASELFFKKSNHQKATLEHSEKVDGTTIVESWIVENSKTDKSALYGMDMPVGTWMVSMKIDNEDIYKKAVNKEIRGFSIEGYFADKYDLNTESLKDLEERFTIEELKELLSQEKLASYNDYPESVSNNEN